MIEFARPQPSSPPPAGHHHVPVAEPLDQWRPAPQTKRCRANATKNVRACGRPAVLEFLRPGRYRYGKRPGVWWAYCEQHTFGRWLEGDRVMCWHVRPDGDPDG